MNKLLLLLLVSSCHILGQLPQNKQITDKYALPEELKHCSIFYLDSPKDTDLYVVNCPNSQTTTSFSYTHGKTRRTETITLINKGLQ